MGVSSIEVTDSNIKSFERVARKYNVDFAVKKDRTCEPPKYLVFSRAGMPMHCRRHSRNLFMVMRKERQDFRKGEIKAFQGSSVTG